MAELAHHVSRVLAEHHEHRRERVAELVRGDAGGQQRLAAVGEQLVGALDDGEDNVRLAAARALARMRADPDLVRAPLLRILADPDSRVRAAAARALRRLGPDPATERALDERARSDPDETVRAEARHALKPGRPR